MKEIKWSGEGLPAKGSVCELMRLGIFEKVEIVFIGKIIAVVRFADGNQQQIFLHDAIFRAINENAKEAKTLSSFAFNLYDIDCKKVGQK